MGTDSSAGLEILERRDTLLLFKSPRLVRGGVAALSLHPWRGPEAVDLGWAFGGLHAWYLGAGAKQLPRRKEVEVSFGEASEWVDRHARLWKLDEILAAGGSNVWVLLRPHLVQWIQDAVREWRLLQSLAGDGQLNVVAFGLEARRRAMLRVLSEASGGRIKSETAFFLESPPGAGERARRRVRTAFFLLQDAWHAVRFLVEALGRRPTVVFVSGERQLLRHWGLPPSRRTDPLLEPVWRAGGGRRLRLYYKAESYHPDVGAMTSGRLAPAYLRHFLFLLAQGSRGLWEVRSIQRRWSDLRASLGSAEGLELRGVPVGRLALDWLDVAVRTVVPTAVRQMRRESHFLAGTSPDVLLAPLGDAGAQPVVAAALQKRIPTVCVQQRPLDEEDFASLQMHSGRGLPVRVCAFSVAEKEALVEAGIVPPAQVAVCGDPRLDLGLPSRRHLDSRYLERVRRRWGVEDGQRVVAVSMGRSIAGGVLAALGRTFGADRSVFVLVVHRSGAGLSSGDLASYGLEWAHATEDPGYFGWQAAADVLIVTRWPDAAEGVLAGTHVVLVAPSHAPAAACARATAPLVRAVEDAAKLPEVVAELLGSVSEPPEPPPDFVRGVFGAEGEAGSRVMDLVERILEGG